MSDQFMRFGYSGGGQAHGGNAGAITGADGQVAGHGEGFGRQGVPAHLAAPFVEKLPLGLIDALGVVGEDGLQGVGHPLVGGAQGRRSRRGAGTICGSAAVVVVMRVSSWAREGGFRKVKNAR